MNWISSHSSMCSICVCNAVIRSGVMISHSCTEFAWMFSARAPAMKSSILLLTPAWWEVMDLRKWEEGQGWEHINTKIQFHTHGHTHTKRQYQAESDKQCMLLCVYHILTTYWVIKKNTCTELHHQYSISNYKITQKKLQIQSQQQLGS